MKMLLSVVALAGIDFVVRHPSTRTRHDGAGQCGTQERGRCDRGQWQMSSQTPHGPMKAGLQVKQDGTKITGTCDMDHMGSMALAGTVDGKKISFTIEIQGGQKIMFSGMIDGEEDERHHDLKAANGPRPAYETEIAAVLLASPPRSVRRRRKRFWAPSPSSRRTRLRSCVKSDAGEKVVCSVRNGHRGGADPAGRT